MESRLYRTPQDRARYALLSDLEDRGITDRCVLAAMSVVPRTWFPSPPDAYRLAKMLQDLELQPSDIVLEVGTGSGYSAAVISQLVHHVYSVEHDPLTAIHARDRLATLRFDGIDIRCADIAAGWPEHAPYDVIVVHDGYVPDALYTQLKRGGRLLGDSWLEAS